MIIPEKWEESRMDKNHRRYISDVRSEENYNTFFSADNEKRWAEHN
jgi:hypothetical protein